MLIKKRIKYFKVYRWEIKVVNDISKKKLNFFVLLSEYENYIFLF